MTPRDLKSAREALGLSQAAFARLVGLTSADADRTVRRWEGGERATPGTVTTLLRLIDEHPSTLAALKRMAGFGAP